MTLEKLLIFGFALAVFTAVTFLATDVTSDRQDQTTGYRSKVEALKAKAP